MKRGRLTLTFDDGYEHILRTIIPELERRAIPGVFAIPLKPERVTTDEHNSVAPLTRWLKIGKQHELAAHGITHRDLTTLTSSELMSELSEPAATVRATSVVYPGGAYNNDVLRAAAEHYTRGRTTEYGFNTVTPDTPLRLRTINYSKNNWSLWKANARVLYAMATNKWLIETYHIVANSSDELHSVPLDGFIAHLDFIVRSGIPVTTLRSNT